MKRAESPHQANNKFSKRRDSRPCTSFKKVENIVNEDLAKARKVMLQDWALVSEMADLKQLTPEARPKCYGCGRPLVVNGKQACRLFSNHEPRMYSRKQGLISYRSAKEFQKEITDMVS
jgi:hypothetical protein